jgi:uncharacterized protein DUF3883
MTKEEDLVYTPGKIIIVWQTVYFASRHEGLSMPDLSSMILEGGILGGSVPLADAIRLGKYCGFIQVQDGKILLTPAGQDELLPLCNSKDPNLAVVRFVLKTIIRSSLRNFHWLLSFDKDVEVFKLAIPADWIDLLDQAELLDFFQPEVEAWWDAIWQTVLSFDESTKKEIGDVGEKLTVDYEMERLSSDGIPQPQHHVKWVSRFSDAYGYDVLSINVEREKSKAKNPSPSQIEVKSTVARSTEKFVFKLSRNEWTTAVAHLSSYFFYCWLGINLTTLTASDGPYVVPAKRFLKIVPVDQDQAGEWSECKITIDLNAFSI